MKLMYVVLIDW